MLYVISEQYIRWSIIWYRYYSYTGLQKCTIHPLDMRSAALVVLMALCLTSSLADISVKDYIYWKKADIVAWDAYFPKRYLAAERQTNQAAVDAVNSLSVSLNDSLASVVVFQAQELQTAETLMAGTDAEGCIQGISTFMQEAIADELMAYEDCAADALSRLSRLNRTLDRVEANYQNAYLRALNGIDACAKTYPNKDSIARLQSCVESMNKNYFSVANVTMDAVVPSQSMNYFQNSVVDCASTAAINVASKGSQFLNMLFECSALDPSIDQDNYYQELNHWYGYTDTLTYQIMYAQIIYAEQVRALEANMTYFYELQKEALQNYVIESRGVNFYLNKMYGFLSDYYNTVTSTSIDNPAEANCAATARADLDELARTSANSSLSCDLNIVNNTKDLMAEVNSIFTSVNSVLPSVGNAALLNCFVPGYIFANNTIADCYQLKSTAFDVDLSDQKAKIDHDIDILVGYVRTFFSGSDLPCGGSSLKRAYLAADTALYNLQRCLYVQSGTTYSVTTPQPQFSESWYY